MKRPYRLAITSGDTDGIGLEIATKALARLGPQKDAQFILWRSQKAPKKDLARLDSKFRRITVSSWHEALMFTPSSSKELLDISSPLSPATWVEFSAQAATMGNIDALTTAPLSKTVIQQAGLKDIGHTDILKRVSGASHVFMGFIGDKFSVVLATGHLPISKVHSELTLSTLERATVAGLLLRRLMDAKKRKRPVALLGLNPHAGEGGIIGDEEVRLHAGLIKSLRERKLAVEGPLVPDVAFFKESYDRYSVFIANYHDQGLIPFKSLHPNHGNIHITLGLPFIRTSVDHGTAKDIFGKNRAEPKSMANAIKFALELCRNKSHVEFET